MKFAYLIASSILPFMLGISVLANSGFADSAIPLHRSAFGDPELRKDGLTKFTLTLSSSDAAELRACQPIILFDCYDMPGLVLGIEVVAANETKITLLVNAKGVNSACLPPLLKIPNRLSLPSEFKSEHSECIKRQENK